MPESINEKIITALASHHPVRQGKLTSVYLGDNEYHELLREVDKHTQSPAVHIDEIKGKTIHGLKIFKVAKNSHFRVV